MASTGTALIIGAGIGGIATSIFLAKNGYRVDVYEKNRRTRRSMRTDNP